MFITVLFLIAKNWKQLSCPSVDQWINCGTSIHWNIIQWFIFFLKRYQATQKHGELKCNLNVCCWVKGRQWHPTPVLLPGKSHGWRSLVGCSPWGRTESDRTERLHFHFSLSCIGEGNGNPVQCSCLENPGDGGAWWASVYGVAQSRTRLTQLSSSSKWKEPIWKAYILYDSNYKTTW